MLASFDYLRFTDDSQPAAGRFEGWPDSVAEVTVMDLCCGSGHFLVAAFDMLRKMREEEEGLSTRDAVDAVLADNLYGLELDARCVQLAAFALALAAWKAVGYQALPTLNLACSGIPTRGSLEEWTKLARGDERLERALTRLHELFREADTLGSLIDPRRAVEDGTLMSMPFEEVAPLLERALSSDPDPVAAVFGESAREVAKAATLLAGTYTLVATNPPYLGRAKQSAFLRGHCESAYPDERLDLATCVMARASAMCKRAGAVSVVSPWGWMFAAKFRRFREKLLASARFQVVSRLGEGGFHNSAAAGAFTALVIWSACAPDDESAFAWLDASALAGPGEKAAELREGGLFMSLQRSQLGNPGARILVETVSQAKPLGDSCHSYQGIKTGDDAAHRRVIWEFPARPQGWRLFQSTTSDTRLDGGCDSFLWWGEDGGHLARLRAMQAWGKRGVAVNLMRGLECSRYSREAFDSNIAAVVVDSARDEAALWCYCASGRLLSDVRVIDPGVKANTGSLNQVPFDLAHWQKVAEEQYPNGLPEPHSEDPTQWLFKGNVLGSEQPLHVALARLVGYRWPNQEPDELDALADEDGIICLPAVAGERPAHERLRQLLEIAHGQGFSQQTLDELLAPEGSTTLEEWLRDRAFASHTKLFHNRPFIWHLWDGRKDGFAALVNYHKLDEQTLQKLTYTYLGWWLDRQKADAGAEVAGAEARLSAATELQTKLKLILEGEAPYDIFVRWKSLAEQPLGWQPDLNDGVRLNIRPFVTAGVLRAKLSSIQWNKDRGKNPDGSGRLNDLHLTLAEKRAARQEGRTGE